LKGKNASSHNRNNNFILEIGKRPNPTEKADLGWVFIVMKYFGRISTIGI
jgi:hypothetical protein